MQDADNKRAVEALAERFMHKATSVKVSVLTKGAAQETPRSLAEKKTEDEQQRREAIRREVTEHPVVQEALRLLEGEIVEIKEL